MCKVRILPSRFRNFTVLCFNQTVKKSVSRRPSKDLAAFFSCQLPNVILVP